MREAQVLESDSDSDDSGPVFGGRSDDEGAAVISIVSPRGNTTRVLGQSTTGAWHQWHQENIH